MNIKLNDTVEVITGKDKTKRGKVIAVFPKINKVIVEGINVATKHKKARRPEDVAGIIKKEMPLYTWNVALVCTSCKEKSRMGSKKLDDGTKVRICKKCSAEN